MSKHVHFNVSCKNLTLNRAVITAALCLVIYNQFLCFNVCTWLWPRQPQIEDGDLQILFVADPQLIGLRDEPPVLGYITRWDSDRYLRLSFWQALGYVRPDVIVFLGDLLDEGSLGSDEEFDSYVQRFRTVFRTPTHVQNIFIPGDNDVGGEGERKELWKINRFRRYFDEMSLTSLLAGDVDVSTTRFVDFFKVSFDFGERVEESSIQRWLNMSQHSHAEYRVICNHMALLRRSPASYEKIVKIIKPHIIVTAHSHLAQLYRCHDCRSVEVSANIRQQPLPPWLGDVVDLADSGPVNINLSDLSVLHELTVPTCSYRMGVPNMGFGAATLRRDGTMSFSVLWLPSRYRQLASYVIFIILVLLLMTVRVSCVLFKHIFKRPPSLLVQPSTFKYS